MLKNRMLELENFSERSTNIGSKLITPIVKQNTVDDEFEPIRQMIRKVDKRSSEIDLLRQDLTKAVNPKAIKQIHNKLTQLISENRIVLKDLEKSIKYVNQIYVKTPNADGPKRTTTQDLTIKAKKSVEQFRAAEQKFSNSVRDSVRRQATIMQGEISQEEVDNLMTNPLKGQQMLKAKLLNSPSAELESAVSDILDKYRDIVKLERDMQECMSLTQELALLVALQGEQIDTIEITLGQANDYVQNGEVALVKAKQHHKSAQKKILCIIFLVMLGLGAVLIPVVITQVMK